MTLFSYPEFTIQRFKTEYNLDISSQFLACADMQLSQLFIKITGLKFNKNLCISWASSDEFYYIRDAISRISFKLYVNHNWNELSIVWKSCSGRVYEISDNDIDCNDIDFSFEHLDIDLYLKQLYPKTNLPFKIKDISYYLKVTRLNLDATFKLIPKEDFRNGCELIVEEVNGFLNDFNLKSEKNSRSAGVIHNFKVAFEADHTIVYEIDMGSTGLTFLKRFLTFLSKMNKLSAVEIE